MRQYHLDSAIARATGESLRTIQQRGFGLVRMDSDRSTRRSASNVTSASQSAHAEHAVTDFRPQDSDY